MDPSPTEVSVALTASTFLMALAFESNMRGIVSAVARIKNDDTIIAKIILFTNAASMLQIVGFEWANYTTKSTCAPVNLLSNLAYHLMMLSFDAFLLYKTWLVSSRQRRVLIPASVLVLHRLCWGIVDLMHSFGTWDVASQSCIWIPDPNAAYGFYSADILCDLFSTVATVLVCRRYLSSDIRKLFVVLISENVLRSVVSLAIVSLGFWVVKTQSFVKVMYLSGLQTYAFSHLLNSEFYWYRARSEALQDTPPAQKYQDNTSRHVAPAVDTHSHTSVVIPPDWENAVNSDRLERTNTSSSFRIVRVL